MNNLAFEFVIVEVLTALDVGHLVDVNASAKKLHALCMLDGVSEQQLRDAVISMSLERGAGIVVDADCETDPISADSENR